MTKQEDQDVRIARLEERVNALESRAKHWVTGEAYRPVRLIVYSGVGVALIAVAGAVIALVIKQ